MTGPDFLALTQLLSPAFPTGAFAYSQGLEWAVATGRVDNADGLRCWLMDGLSFGAARVDAVLLAHALQPDADLAALDAIARALAPSRERAEETVALGAAFDRVAAVLRGIPPAGHALPVAVGRVVRGLQVDPETVIALYLQGWAGSLVQIGVRVIPLGQTEGQQVLAALGAGIATLSKQALTLPVGELTTSTFTGDLGGMLHETQDVRLFRT